MVVSTQGVSTEIIQYLIDRGSDLNARDIYGRTVLMHSTRGQPKILPVLLEAGADVNARDLRGWTALMYAAITPFPSTLQLILDAGADPRMVTDEGITALDLARKNALINNSEAFKQLEELSK